jgi:hypothetical protein
MGYQPKLGFTVHHGGRVYEAGTTAEDLGDVAYKFGDHVWEGGVTPVKPVTPAGGQGDDAGGDGGGDPPAPTGTLLGSPTIPTPSALPSPAATTEVGAVPDAEVDDGAAAAKAGRGRR